MPHARKSYPVNRRTAPTRPPFLLLVSALLSCALLFGAVWWGIGRLQQPTPVRPAFDPATLETAWADIAAANTGMTIGVVVTDVATGTTATYGDSASFRAASTTKLLTALYFLHQVEAGEHSLDELVALRSAREQLELLITYSNNESWTAFLDVLGRDDQDRYAKELGLYSYRLADNTVSPRDMSTIVARLYAGELLQPEHTRLLLSLMQDTIEERFLPTALPPNTTLYHKYGALEDDVHDVGIAVVQGRPFVIAVYTNGNGYQDYEARAGLFQDLLRPFNEAVSSLAAPT